jgi:protease I
MGKLSEFSIAMLVTDGFEQAEMVKPREALEKEGARVTLIAPKNKEVKSWKENEWSEVFAVDILLEQANAHDYHALILPGGVISPDTLRITPRAIEFIKEFVDQHKLIAAICHGPWTLINAHAVKGRTITSWPSLEIDLKNAGAQWVNHPVVIDGNIITSRKPEDIPAFNEAIIAELVVRFKNKK